MIKKDKNKHGTLLRPVIIWADDWNGQPEEIDIDEELNVAEAEVCAFLVREDDKEYEVTQEVFRKDKTKRYTTTICKKDVKRIKYL